MKNLLRLRPYVRKNRWQFIGGFIAVGLANALSLLVIYFVGQASEAIEQIGKARETGLAITTGAKDFAWFAVQIIGFTMVLGVGRYYMRQWLIGASRNIEADFRNDIFSKLQSLAPAYYDRQRTGDLMAKATSDVEAVRSFIGPGVLQFFNSALLFPLALARMFYIDPRLATFTLTPLLSLPFVMNYFGNRVHKRFRTVQDTNSVITAMVQENLAGVRVVKAFGQEEAQNARFAELNRTFIADNLNLARIQSGFYPVLRALATSSIVILLWVGGTEVVEGQITIGNLVEFSLIQTMLFWPLIAFGWTVSLMQRGAASMDRLAEILDLPSYLPIVNSKAIALHPDQALRLLEADNTPGKVEFRNLSFKYSSNGPTVLKDLNITIEAGQRLGVVGSTGSGKSTLASLLTRLYAVNDGELFIDGKDINSIQIPELRSRVGKVFQETFLFSDSIRSNIAFGYPNATQEAVEKAAATAHIADEIKAFPRGYDTMLGERGINLSGGQKQRTAIARALLRDPGILVLDDALSAVDTETEARILGSLHEALADRTAIIIAHRVSAVMDCEEIIVLDEGSIIERGTHEELLAAKGEYADLFTKQLLADEVELEAG